MAQQAQPAQSPTLQMGIIQALQGASKPLRAVDIARVLTDGGTPANASSVNTVLYRGPFEKVAGAGTPVWKVREDAWAIPAPVLMFARRAEGRVFISVEGVGVLALDPTLSDEELSALLACLATLIPASSPKRLLHDATAGGKRVALLAVSVGFSPVETA